MNVGTNLHPVQTAGRISAFCVRHLLAVMATVFVACFLWTVSYFALFLWAVVVGGGLGSPVVYPLGLLLVLVFATAVSLLLLFPSTAVAEWVARRENLPIFAQIPVAIFVLAILCGIAATFVAGFGDSSSSQQVAFNFGVLLGLHLVPLGFYWWIAQSGPLTVSAISRIRSMFRKTSTSSETIHHPKHRGGGFTMF